MGPPYIYLEKRNVIFSGKNQSDGEGSMRYQFLPWGKDRDDFIFFLIISINEKISVANRDNCSNV
jgi:hypothetical protein